MGWVIGHGNSFIFRQGGGQKWSSYWATRYISALSVLTTGATTKTITATIVGTGYDGLSYEYSTDRGVTYTEHGTSVDGTYNATGLNPDLDYLWRARLYKGANYSNYSAIASVYANRAGVVIHGSHDAVGVFELFAAYGKSVTFEVTGVGNLTAPAITRMQALVAMGHKLSPRSNIATTASAFIVNATTPNNQQYYQEQDDLEDLADKGIQEFYIYDGKNYCLLNVEYPAVPGSQSDFSTIAGGSNITIAGLTGVEALFLDSTKTYAADFPPSALDKWWLPVNISGNTWALRMNGIVPLEVYCGAAISDSNDFTAGNGIGKAAFKTFYPRLAGVKYILQENVRVLTALGFTRPYCDGEIERGGYITRAIYGDAAITAIFEGAGYLGAIRDPRAYAYTRMPDSDRYKIPDAQGLGVPATVDLCKALIADNYTKNIWTFWRGLTTLSAPMDLAGIEEIIQFCDTNNIPIYNLDDYAVRNFDRTIDQFSNIFPRLYKDIAARASGTPDGFTTIPAGVTVETSGGHDIDNGYYLEFANATAAVVGIANLQGFNGDSKLSFYARNDNTAYDYVDFTVRRGAVAEQNEKVVSIPIKSATWKKYEYIFSRTAYEMFINVSTWASAGTVDISGIEITDNIITVNEAGNETETETYLTRVDAVGDLPDAARQAIINNTIKALKQAAITDVNGNIGKVNLFERVIALHTHAAHNEAAAKLSWKNDLFNIVTYNAPVYTADKGWTLNGTTQYLGTGFNPASIAVEDREWVEANCCLMIGTNTASETINATVDIGARDEWVYAQASQIAINWNATYMVFGLNCAAQTNVSIPDPRKGIFGITISNKNKIHALTNVTESAYPKPAQTLTNFEFLYGRGGAATYSNKRYCFGLIARGLSKAELLKFATIMKDTYLDPIAGLD